ncbi:serine/threonine protein kinase [Microbacterium terrae]|uniref:non-specific serine/threonine protein kinase n=1 Tax=Microbacterium terrae TaxID=69369 RepID=A0A0M2H832_9MICO|nr:serine/threonine-protein kinase [Microbacterium terrae]KJL42680.1 Serine/threonine-protein kinase PknK [Microbacterium terrae]MBP1078607.1 serine/threonine protein kinase [Microbacterium terrae]GLJ98008.1 serine/threonine protein kinase [Microbacterium terrae]
MSGKRAPMAPPDLPGFTFVEVLGSGGFADVYLYEQQLPKRRVAVKVLLTERMSSGSVEEFTAEANVMAMLSTHPAIVTIYQAGVARDGRPYLVMEYCPRPNLQVRYRREPFGVAESLRVGVQVAAAVETAHRAGVLHRDIKPANILVTEYNRPALTDFGIASTSTVAAESAGLSIPWSPPESFADVPRSDPRSDVYALGATVYTLLAARSPFELPGQRNTAADLIQRIETAPLSPLGRADVPPSLEQVLARAMSKNPADRYESAIAFARSLQKVQIELSHSVTAIDILDDHVPDDVVEDDDDGLTRVRGVVSINPMTTPAAGATRPSAITSPKSAPVAVPPFSYADDVDSTVLRPAAAPAAAAAPPPAASVTAPPAWGDTTDATVLRAPAPAAPQAPDWPTHSATAPLAHDHTTQPLGGTEAPPPPPKRSRVGLWVGIAAGVVVLCGVAVGASLLAQTGAGTPESTPTAAQGSEPQDPIAVAAPEPEDVTGTVVDDGVRFTWTNPDPQEGDYYLYGVVTRADAEPTFEDTLDTEVTVPADDSGTTCIDVMLVRAKGANSDAVRECAP